MDDDSCTKFIGSLTKYLQSLCHSYVDFNNGVELVGHIYLHVDRGKKIDYVLNESVCKNGSNVVKFTSNSYHAQPADKKEKKEPPKKASDPSRPGGEDSRRRDDNDVIIVGSEAAKRRRASLSGMSQAQHPPTSSSSAQSGSGGRGAGIAPSSAGVFRHPRAPNPRMGAPAPPGPRPGSYQYHMRKRLPSPQQPRSYLPMGASGYNPRMRQPLYQPHGVQPIGGRGTFPVPSDVASIRGGYPPASGGAGMGDKGGDPRFQHPFHSHPARPLPMQQGHHPQPSMGSGSQGRAPHLVTSMGSHLPTSMGPHHQNPMGAHLSSSMGPQGLLQGPQAHGQRFLPPYPLSSHSQRQAPSMSLPVTTQVTTSHPSATAAPTTTVVPPINTAPTTTTAPASTSAPAAGTVMIKGRPVPIPASLTATGQSSVPEQDGSQAKARPSSSSGASVPSFLHHSQPSATSSGSGGSSKPVSALSHDAPGSQPRDMTKSSSSSSATFGGADSQSTAMSKAGVPGLQMLTGISPKGRPSTPALEQCAAKKGLPPRGGGGSHFQFPPEGSSSQSSFPTGASGPPCVSGAQTFTSHSSKIPTATSAADHSASKANLSPQAGGPSGYFRSPGAESSQPCLPGDASTHPYSSLSINIPPISAASGGNPSHPGVGGNLHSPRAGERSNPYNNLSGMDLSHPLSGSNLHSPRGAERSHPFRDITNSSLSHLSTSGSNSQSPRASDRSHPYMGSSNVSHSSFSGSGQLSPRVASGSQPYMGSSNMSHSAVGGSNLHSPRAGNGSLPYMGSSHVSHVSSASESNLYSPRASYGSHPYMGSSHVSHASVSEGNLHSPHGSSTGHPYMGSSNVSHPSDTDSNLRSPRGADRHYPSFSDMGSSKLSHPPVSAGNLASPRGDRSHANVAGSENSERTQLFSSLTGNSLPYSSGGAGNVSFPSLTHSDPFPSVNGTYFPFTPLSDSDLPYPPPGGNSNHPYPPVQNGRLPFPPLSGSSLPYPTFGDSNLPFSSVSGNNLPCPPAGLSDMPAEEGVNSVLSQDRVRQSDSMFDMFSQQAETDPLEARFTPPPHTDPMEARFTPPPHTDPMEARFQQLPQTDGLAARAPPSDLPPSSTFPLNLSHAASFALDQGPSDGDGYSELVSELQALNQPPLNEAPTSPASPLSGEHIPEPGGLHLSEEGYPESDAQGEQLMNAQAQTSGFEGEGKEDPAPPRVPDSEGRSDEEGQGQDSAGPETTASVCQTTSQAVAREVPQTFLAPYEISGGGCGAGAGGGGEEFQKRSGSVSSHSHETPSPSPGSVAGTETVVTETKPPGQQASDYDSGCDSGSTSTGERLASPQAQAQSSAPLPQLKALTIPLVPVDSPSSSARVYIKQERPSGEEGEPAGEKPPPPEWSKDMDSDWVADMAALNNSDSTESYSEDDDPDYVPEIPRSTKGSVKRTRSKKTERVSRGKKRKVDSEEKAGGEREGHNPGKGAAHAEEDGASEPSAHEESAEDPETKDEDRYDPGMFLLLDTPTETDRTGRGKSSHTPAEVISTPEGEPEGLWVHTLVPAGHGLWRLPPDDHKCQVKVDPTHILRTLYKVTVKIVAGKVLYKFEDM